MRGGEDAVIAVLAGDGLIEVQRAVELEHFHLAADTALLNGIDARLRLEHDVLADEFPCWTPFKF